MTQNIPDPDKMIDRSVTARFRITRKRNTSVDVDNTKNDAILALKNAVRKKVQDYLPPDEINKITG